MKTKNGNCDSCCLADKPKYDNFVIALDNKNLSNPDIFVVTNTKKHGRELFDFFKAKYADKKFVVVNYVICQGSDEEHESCKNFCFKNFQNLSKILNAKNCFIFDVNKYDVDTTGFTFCSDTKSLESKLEEIYHPVEDLGCKHYMFRIPDEYYTDKYRLIDIQYTKHNDRLLYIFRDENNKKVFYEYPHSKDNFYWYESVSSNRIVEDLDNLKLVTGKYSERNLFKNGYGGDVDITTKHCVDYYLQTKGECKIKKQNMMFFDIETYQGYDNIFPDPDEAKYPIVAFSFRTGDETDHTHVYLLKLPDIDKRVDECVKKYPHITLFNDEITMLKTFFRQLKAYDIDYTIAWNGSGFDIPYVINRSKNLGIDTRLINGFGDCYAIAKTGKNHIPGMVSLDSLKLYKEFTHGILPSYSLNNVAKKVLGQEKVQHVNMSIDKMYRDDIDLFMRYSETDTELIYNIEKTLGHCALQNEIRRVATCSHQGATSTLGQADGIYQMILKQKGSISRNYMHDVEQEIIIGAYVFDPRPGIYDGLLCDFDFKSLYPSIICTWNIGPDTYIGRISKEDAYLYLFDKAQLRKRKIKICVDPLYQCRTIEVTLDQLEQFIEKYHAQITIVGTIFMGHDIKESINYRVLNMLMDSRAKYKKKMLEAKAAGDKILATEYNDKQLAFKIIANALYGALGNEHFRFYNPALGNSITGTGQEMLKYSAVHTDYYMQGKYKKEDGSDFFIDPKFAEKVVKTINVVYGDTDSVFVYLTDYLKKKGLPVKKCEEVLKEVKKLQDFINGVILPNVLKLHHVKPERSQMYLKNEFLMDRYYALNAKKKYGSHVISQEGKDIDEVDVKGLEIKRSEIPPRSQKMLKDILEVILDKSNTKSQIKSKVKKISDDARTDIYNLTLAGDLGVSKTVSYSKKPEEYKVTPQHLLGMLTWNALVGKEEFKYGSKGKLFNLLGIDLNKAPKEIQDNYYNEYLKKFPNTKIECIVLPEGVEKLPEYFVVDLKTTVQYACDDRVELMMSGLYTEVDSDLLF